VAAWAYAARANIFLEKGNFNQREFQSMWDGTEVGGGRINYLFIF